jgi:hypothetical protein
MLRHEEAVLGPVISIFVVPTLTEIKLIVASTPSPFAVEPGLAKVAASEVIFLPVSFISFARKSVVRILFRNGPLDVVICNLFPVYISHWCHLSIF